MKKRITPDHLNVNKRMARGKLTPEDAVRLLRSIPGGNMTSAHRKAMERVVDDETFNRELDR